MCVTEAVGFIANKGNGIISFLFIYVFTYFLIYLFFDRFLIYLTTVSKFSFPEKGRKEYISQKYGLYTLGF